MICHNTMFISYEANEKWYYIPNGLLKKTNYIY